MIGTLKVNDAISRPDPESLLQKFLQLPLRIRMFLAGQHLRKIAIDEAKHKIASRFQPAVERNGADERLEGSGEHAVSRALRNPLARPEVEIGSEFDLPRPADEPFRPHQRNAPG